jgi:ubiquinone/menaquinone biosynthesis C-methylase UbiE
MKRKPVDSDQYNKEWIDSAWGSEKNASLLSATHIVPRPRAQRAIELANIQPGLSVLDIACGRGEIPAIVSAAGAHAVGIDYSQDSIEFANRIKLAQDKNGRTSGSMSLVRADACKLPFSDCSFDRITMLDIVEHLVPDQLDIMFREVKRLLKPDGYAIIHTLPNSWVYDITYKFIRYIIPRLPRDPRNEFEKLVHVNEQNVPRLHHALTAAGLPHRIWLEQLMPAQARWNAANNRHGDNRDTIYPALLGSRGRMLELLSATPLKALLCNDIFAIVWKDKKPEGIRLKTALLERALGFFPHKQQ